MSRFFQNYFIRTYSKAEICLKILFFVWRLVGGTEARRYNPAGKRTHTIHSTRVTPVLDCSSLRANNEGGGHNYRLLEPRINMKQGLKSVVRVE